MAGQTDELMSIDELADYLGVSVQTIYQWRHSDKNRPEGTKAQGPPSAKLNRNLIRYRKSDVDAWLDAHTEGRRSAV